MPRLSVVRQDGVVYVEERGIKVKCDDLPSYLHAIQWDGKIGWIEFESAENGQKLPNLQFTDVSPFLFLVDRWNRERARIQDEEDRKNKEEERKKAEEEVTKARPEQTAVEVLKDKQDKQEKQDGQPTP